MRVATATRPRTVIGVRPDAQTPRASAAPCPAGLEAGSRPRSRAPAVHVMIPKYLIAAEARVLCARRRCITQLVAQTPIKAPAPQDLGLLGSRGSEYGAESILTPVCARGWPGLTQIGVLCSGEDAGGRGRGVHRPVPWVAHCPVCGAGRGHPRDPLLPPIRPLPVGTHAVLAI